jgi:hypothetical protein
MAFDLERAVAEYCARMGVEHMLGSDAQAAFAAAFREEVETLLEREHLRREDAFRRTCDEVDDPVAFARAATEAAVQETAAAEDEADVEEEIPETPEAQSLGLATALAAVMVVHGAAMAITLFVSRPLRETLRGPLRQAYEDYPPVVLLFGGLTFLVFYGLALWAGYHLVWRAKHSRDGRVAAALVIRHGRALVLMMTAGWLTALALLLGSWRWRFLPFYPLPGRSYRRLGEDAVYWGYLVDLFLPFIAVGALAYLACYAVDRDGTTRGTRASAACMPATGFALFAASIMGLPILWHAILVLFGAPWYLATQQTLGEFGRIFGVNMGLSLLACMTGWAVFEFDRRRQEA